MAEQETDPLVDVLNRSPLTTAQRKALFDVYEDSADADALAAKMDLVPLPTSVKRALWDLKEAEAAAPSAPEEPAGPASRFVSNAWEKVDPVAFGTGMYELARTDIRDVAKGLYAASAEQAQMGEKARQEGDYLTAAGRTALGFPVVGPMAAEIYEQAKSGDIAGAAGSAVGILAGPKIYSTAFRLPGQTLRTAQRGTRAVLGSKLEPVVQEAVEYGLQRGIPVDAATATGNPAVRGTQALVDRSIGGAPVAMHAERAKNAGLTREGQSLAGRAAPRAATPESVGLDIRDTVTRRVDDLKREADLHYGQLRAIENNPANARPMQVGTRVDPATGATVPVIESVALPADLRAVKAALRPAYERLQQQYPIAQQQASAGFRALENIINGPDAVPLSELDAALSVMKKMTREAQSPALRNVSQGIAALAVRELEPVIQQAAAQAPQATAALAAGRQAARTKATTAAVLKEVTKEPVLVFRQATWADDAGIERLRRVAREAPNEMRKLGRAYLDDMFGGATTEQGWQGAQKMLSDWNNLGPQTKALIFPDAAHRADLDKFFLLAKKMAENPNPSGTGNLVSLGAQGIAIVTNPVTAGATLLSPAILSGLLHNQRFVTWLVRGMQTPATRAATPLWENLRKAVAAAPVAAAAAEPATRENR